jgi:hypothetical protein
MSQFQQLVSFLGPFLELDSKGHKEEEALRSKNFGRGMKGTTSSKVGEYNLICRALKGV